MYAPGYHDRFEFIPRWWQLAADFGFGTWFLAAAITLARSGAVAAGGVLLGCLLLAAVAATHARGLWLPTVAVSTVAGAGIVVLAALGAIIR